MGPASCFLWPVVGFGDDVQCFGVALESPRTPCCGHWRAGLYVLHKWTSSLLQILNVLEKSTDFTVHLFLFLRTERLTQKS